MLPQIDSSSLLSPWPCTKGVTKFAKEKPPKLVRFARMKLELNISCANIIIRWMCLVEHVSMSHSLKLKKKIFVVVKLIFVVVATIYIFYYYFQFN